MTDQEKRSQFIDSLRELAQFYTDHPDFPFPTLAITLNVFLHGPEAKADFARFARLMGKAEKNGDEHYLWVRRHFGELIRLDLNAARETVCERIVTGTKVIPAHAIPAQSIPARTEEIVEWRCAPILEGDDVHRG